MLHRFPVATRMRRFNNRSLAEEQEENKHSQRQGDFQQSRTLPQNMCACVCMCGWMSSCMHTIFWESRNTHTHARDLQNTHTHKQVQPHGYPLACIHHNSYCFYCLHPGIHDYKMKSKQKQDRIHCVMICVCVHKHLAHNNILHILLEVNNNTAEVARGLPSLLKDI